MKRLIAFLLVCAAGSLLAASNKLVRVAFYPLNGWCEIDSEGRRKGYVPDWIAAIASRCAWNVKWVQCTWTDSIDLLKKGEVDLVMGIAYDARLGKECLFSQVPFALLPAYLFVHSDDARFSRPSIMALDGLRVGLVKNYHHNEILLRYLARKGIDRCAFRHYSTDAALARAFVAGEVDAVLNDVEKTYSESFAVPLLALPRLPLFAGVSPRRPDLVREIDSAIARVLEESPEFTKQVRARNRPYRLSSPPRIDGVSDPALGEAMFELLQNAHPDVPHTVSVADGTQFTYFLSWGLAGCVVLLILIGGYLLWALRAAKAGERMRSNFLALMNHEIRTPLNAVIGCGEFLRQPGLTQEQVSGFANQVLTSSRELLQFLDDVLDLSKLQTGSMDVLDGEVDCHQLFEKLESFFAPQAQDKGVDLSLVAKGVPVLALRETCLRQILVNLIGNAIKFTKKGDVLCRATSVRDGHGTATLVVLVRDTGCGIEPGRLKFLYDPFVESEAIVRDRNRQGVGLGLPIVHRLVSVAGGTIDVRSEIGKGTAFVVRIPGLRVKTKR